jgi:16S rRNA (cytosine967-C5)-methyltransferase
MSAPRYAHARFAQAGALLARVLPAREPADAAIDRYFRAHRQMGSQDRAFAAEQVYACLRHRRLLEHFVTAAWPGEPVTPERLLAAQLMRNAGWSARALAELRVEGADGLARVLRTTQVRALPLALRASLPDWLAEALRAQWGEAEAEQLACALLEPAPVDLRANVLKTTRAGLGDALAALGYACESTPWSPHGLRRHERRPLFHCAPFRDGWFELQDEGSQLVTFLLDPRPGERVVDFCAGSGGKTLHASALMDNRGSLYACDVSRRRLERMRVRLRRAGAANVRTLELAGERDAKLRRQRARMDAVLVDAPCSGSGTLRRNPDMKWRRWDFAALRAQQADILGAAAALVRPGGRLVYATCSLLAAENEEIVAQLLAAQDAFEILPAGAALAARGIDIPRATSPEGYLHLLPHRHGTDGFFAALLRKRAAPEGQ